MPLKVNVGKEQWITPTEEWQSVKPAGFDGKTFEVDRNFFIKTMKTE
jgi:hypothetical protein